jgi:hypothetical protein
VKRLLHVFIPLLIVLPAINSCKKLNRPEQIPSYITVPSAAFTCDQVNQGTQHQIFSDVWAFKGDDFLGCFPIGSRIPVLAEGETQMKFRAGIKHCGIGDLRSIYGPGQFYTTSLNLKKSEVQTVVPEFTYFSGITFTKIESFSAPGTFLAQTPSSNTMLTIYNGPEALPGEGACAYVHLNDTDQVFDVESSAAHSYIQGATAWLEMDYKSTRDFSVAVSDGNISIRPACGIQSSETWKKIYVNLTDALNSPSTLSNFYFVVHAAVPGDGSTADIYFDNIKIIRQ